MHETIEVLKTIRLGKRGLKVLLVAIFLCSCAYFLYQLFLYPEQKAHLQLLSLGILSLYLCEILAWIFVQKFVRM